MALRPMSQKLITHKDGTVEVVGVAASGMAGLGNAGEVGPSKIRAAKLPPGVERKLLRKTHSGKTPYGQTWGPPVQYVEIPGGEQGTVATLKIMKKLVIGKWGHRNPEVVLLAKKIAASASSGPEKNYRAMSQAILDFMKAHVIYQLDPAGLEYVQTPHYTLLSGGSGDCDDHSTATAALAMALGFRAGFRTVKGDPGRPEQWSHVYPVIGIQEGGKTVWLTSDSTQANSELGWNPPESRLFGMKTWVIDPSTSGDTEWDS